VAELKFGLKLWSTNYNLLDQAKKMLENNIFQYVELTPIPKTEIKPFLEVGLPCIIHATTETHGVNIADRKKINFNLDMIRNCIEWANKIDAKYVILHPGFGQIDASVEFLEIVDDRRILIENMPKVGLNGEAMIGYSPQQINKLMGNKFGFCLDLNHAMKASISLNENYEKTIPEFLEFHPKVLHISDGHMSIEKDEHLNINDGEYNFKFLGDCIKKSGAEYLTMETPRSGPGETKNDVLNLSKIMKYL
jgi:deoxyribonuclease-4